MKKKRPGAQFNPTSEKRPRVDEPIDREPDRAVSWHIRILDRGGPWHWDAIDAATLWSELHQKLGNFETMRWSEVLGRRNHEVKQSALCPEARRRLVEIDQDDIEGLVSLHLNGRKRVWGIRDGNVLKILWWDPEHQVCPSLRD